MNKLYWWGGIIAVIIVLGNILIFTSRDDLSGSATAKVIEPIFIHPDDLEIEKTDLVECCTRDDGKACYVLSRFSCEYCSC